MSLGIGASFILLNLGRLVAQTTPSSSNNDGNGALLVHLANSALVPLGMALHLKNKNIPIIPRLIFMFLPLVKLHGPEGLQQSFPDRFDKKFQQFCQITFLVSATALLFLKLPMVGALCIAGFLLGSEMLSLKLDEEQNKLRKKIIDIVNAGATIFSLQFNYNALIPQSAK